MEQDRRLNLNQKLIISSGFAIIIVFSSILSFSLPVLILQIVLGFISLFFCFKTDYRTAKLWLSIFGISMLFVFLVFLANQFYYGEPYYIGGSDDLKFEQWGFDIYNSGIYNPSTIMEFRIIGQFHNSPFFPAYIARLIQFSEFFGGYTTFLPRIVNVYFLLWICMIIKYLLEKYADMSKKAVFYSLFAFAFMPNIQYINAHVFRDTLNLLQILVIALLFDFLINRSSYYLKIISITLSPFLIYSTYYTRASSIPLAAIILLFIISIKYNIRKKYIVISLIPILFANNLLEIFRVGYYIKTYSDYVSNIAGDGLSRLVFNRPLLPLGIFFRAMYAFISPFPNFFGLFREPSKLLFDIIQLFIYFGVLIQIFAIPFIVKRISKLDWISLVFISWFLAVIISTFTFRHFLLYYPFMAAIAVDGYIMTKPNSRNIILFMSIFTTICFGIIYVSLKLFS